MDVIATEGSPLKKFVAATAFAAGLRTCSVTTTAFGMVGLLICFTCVAAVRTAGPLNCCGLSLCAVHLRVDLLICSGLVLDCFHVFLDSYSFSFLLFLSFHPGPPPPVLLFCLGLSGEQCFFFSPKHRLHVVTIYTNTC